MRVLGERIKILGNNFSVIIWCVPDQILYRFVLFDLLLYY